MNINQHTHKAHQIRSTAVQPCLLNVQKQTSLVLLEVQTYLL